MMAVLRYAAGDGSRTEALLVCPAWPALNLDPGNMGLLASLFLAPLWLAGAALIAVLCWSATTNLCLRTRFAAVVTERLQRGGREKELKWLATTREKLEPATAILRTLANLALILVVVNLCEGYGLTALTRNVAVFLLAFLLIVVFGVAIPEGIARYAAGSVIVAALPGLRALHLLSFPLLKGVAAVGAMVRRLSGVPESTPATEADDAEKEILQVVKEGQMQGAVDQEEGDMIKLVMDFADLDVSAVMTPRTEIVALPHGAVYAEAKAVIAETGHSRIPVFEGTIDNILGMLYAKDLLAIDSPETFDLSHTMRTVLFVPDSKPVRELLAELKERKVHIAIVLDEYGGTSGLVTLEDIVEELVGEIADEYEAAEPAPIARIDDHTVDVDARVRVDELNRELDLSLPEHEDYDTIGGLVFNSLGRIPRVGESYQHDNVQIRVVAAEPRRINRLRLQISTPAPPAANT